MWVRVRIRVRAMCVVQQSIDVKVKDMLGKPITAHCGLIYVDVHAGRW